MSSRRSCRSRPCRKAAHEADAAFGAGADGRLGLRQEHHRRAFGRPARLAVPRRGFVPSAAEHRQDEPRHAAHRRRPRALAFGDRGLDRRAACCRRAGDRVLLGAEARLPRRDPRPPRRRQARLSQGRERAHRRAHGGAPRPFHAAGPPRQPVRDAGGARRRRAGARRAGVAAAWRGGVVHPQGAEARPKPLRLIVRGGRGIDRRPEKPEIGAKENAEIRRRIAMTPRALIHAAVAAAGLLLAAEARAQGSLVLYCAVQEEWCRAATTAFERETGIKVSMTRKSSGEVYAQITAEAGLTDEYKSPRLAELNDWAVRQWEQAKGRTVGIYSGALGYGFNTKEIAGKKLAEPKCWADLLDPKLKDEVQVADPNASGTAYTLLATIIQLMGEEKGFDYLKKLHRNVNQYTKSGAAPAKATALGETAVGITFMHDMVTMVVDGAPVKVVAPCEGTGYEIGSMSIVKGARNPDNARKWYEWALSPAAQAIGATNKQYQIPSNRTAPISPHSPKLGEIKLIDFDFAKYGSSEERRRLLSKWDAEIKGAPK